VRIMDVLKNTIVIMDQGERERKCYEINSNLRIKLVGRYQENVDIDI